MKIWDIINYLKWFDEEYNISDIDEETLDEQIYWAKVELLQDYLSNCGLFRHNYFYYNYNKYSFTAGVSWPQGCEGRDYVDELFNYRNHFIHWLVNRDKINWDKVRKYMKDNWIHMVFDSYVDTQKHRINEICALLSIQEDKVRFLCEILK